MNLPLISVVIPNFNGLPFIRQAINSVLQQEYANLELIIVDDGSTDGSVEELKRLIHPQVAILFNQTNVGPGLALKRGVNAAKGKYIARLDADDIMLPHRLHQQVTFMEYNSDIGILGGGAQLIDEAGNVTGQRLPSAIDDKHIQWKILLKNPFINSTVMIRHKVMLDYSINYRDYWGTEDYDLWTRLLRYTKGAQQSNIISQYRINPTGLTATRKASMFENHVEIAARQIEATLSQSYSKEQVATLLQWLEGKLSNQHDTLHEGTQLYLGLLEAFTKNHQKGQISHQLVQTEMERILRRISLRAMKFQVVPVIMSLASISPFTFISSMKGRLGASLLKRLAHPQHIL